jgi:hypothetical protein
MVRIIKDDNQQFLGGDAVVVALSELRQYILNWERSAQ